MNAERRGYKRWLPILGIVLVGIGLTVLFAQVDTAATLLAERVGIGTGEMGGILPAMLVTTLHAAQAWVFDRANLLSAVRGMLLSCWPVILVIVGASLMRKVFNGIVPKRGAAVPAPTEGEN